MAHYRKMDNLPSRGIWPSRTGEFADEYHMISDSQEIAYVLESCPSNWRIERHTSMSKSDISGLFVLAEDGDYSEVWATDDNAPYLLSAEYWRVL